MVKTLIENSNESRWPPGLRSHEGRRANWDRLEDYRRRVGGRRVGGVGGRLVGGRLVGQFNQAEINIIMASDNAHMDQDLFNLNGFFFLKQVKEQLSSSGCPLEMVKTLIENSNESRWPPGLRSHEARRANWDRLKDYCRRVRDSVTIRNQVKEQLSGLGCPLEMVKTLIENSNKSRWPPGLRSEKARRANWDRLKDYRRRVTSNYTIRNVSRTLKAQINLIMASDNAHMDQDLFFRAEDNLRRILEKRGLGADITEALTEDNLQKAIRRLGYEDTVTSLEQVQQTYKNFRIPKTFPSEQLVNDYLTQCVLNQSWVGMTVAKSLEEGAGLGVFVTLPFWANQVVTEYHGKLMPTMETKRLIQILKGEEDGSNYFLQGDNDVTVDAREEAFECHPRQKCFGHLINHKANEDRPNLKLKGVVLVNIKRPLLVATRDISAGEELFFDYGVRPGQFNEGYDLSFLLPKRARKRKRDVLLACAMEGMPDEVGDASSGSSEPSGTKWWEPKKIDKKEAKEEDTSEGSSSSEELSIRSIAAMSSKIVDTESDTNDGKDAATAMKIDSEEDRRQERESTSAKKKYARSKSKFQSSRLRMPEFSTWLARDKASDVKGF
ncbi:hypothetical protein QYM36_010355, partial [Artemia franciscana]